MDLYTFMVEKFFVVVTRAKINDTLWLGYSATVDGDNVAHRSFRMGDFNTGSYNTADHDPSLHASLRGLARIVVNDPTSKVAFIFQLLNAGDVDPDVVNGLISVTASQLSANTSSLAGAGSVLGDVIGGTNIWIALVKGAFSFFYSWLTDGCDGPIAVDQISGPRYVIDAWTDTPTHTVSFSREYAGTSSPFGCNTSEYSVTWWLRHTRAWVEVMVAPVELDNPPANQFVSESAVSAAAHYGAVHAFGVGVGASPFPVTHARTFTGATWTIDVVGTFDLAPTGPQEGDATLPVSALSYDDRLYLFGILKDTSIQILAYTVDGNTWVKQEKTISGLLTTEPIATVAFQHRLYLLARDSGTNHLRMISTDDLDRYSPWVDIAEPAGFPPVSSAAAAVLGETLHIFVLYKNTKSRTREPVIMHNSTADGSTWAGWNTVEGGAHPEGPTAEPLDVAAGIFQNRVYLAARWQPTNHIALNFSEDGVNWSGWRIPQYDVDPDFDPTDLQFGATAALASGGNHLYVFAPSLFPNQDSHHVVWAY